MRQIQRKEGKRMEKKIKKIIEIMHDITLDDVEKAQKICMYFYFDGESEDYIEMEFEGWRLEQKGIVI